MPAVQRPGLDAPSRLFPFCRGCCGLCCVVLCWAMRWWSSPSWHGRVQASCRHMHLPAHSEGVTSRRVPSVRGMGRVRAMLCAGHCLRHVGAAGHGKQVTVGMLPLLCSWGWVCLELLAPLLVTQGCLSISATQAPKPWFYAVVAWTALSGTTNSVCYCLIAITVLGPPGSCPLCCEPSRAGPRTYQHLHSACTAAVCAGACVARPARSISLTAYSRSQAGCDLFHLTLAGCDLHVPGLAHPSSCGCGATVTSVGALVLLVVDGCH
jgi:hypothetical protein